MNNLSERLKPLNELFQNPFYDKKRLEITEYEFQTDILHITLSDRAMCLEIPLVLTKEEVSKWTKVFLEKAITEVDYPVECPEFWYINHFVDSPTRAWLFEEILDVVFWEVSLPCKRISHTQLETA